LRFSVYLNWTLVLANLLPAVPFDLGWALRCLLWPQMGHQRAMSLVRRVSILVALGLLGAAVWAGTHEASFVIPAWVPLAVLGVCVSSFVFSPVDAFQEEGGEEELFGYDFSQGYTSLEQREDPPAARPAGPLRRWIERKRAAREAQRVRIEQEEEQQVDLILARLHAGGLKSISPKERALLYRVSARYRSRAGK
ncbi:MAG: hypothetical protein OES79_14160, partial [Planctomycetota bacterium]|nr:hypothetical protein [Planctomycetota bacterium]